jgi:hypothetical protein
MISKERPGIYSDYIASGIIYGSNATGCVGLIAANSQAELDNVYTITRLNDAETIFGKDSLMLRLCSIILQNGASSIKALSAGDGQLAKYESAFNKLLAQDNIACVICDSSQIEINTLLKNSVIQASLACKERVGIASCSEEYIESFVREINCERIIALKQKAKDALSDTFYGCFIAAAIAGLIASSSDPSSSFNSYALVGITALDKVYTEDEIDYSLKSGIAVCEMIAGKIELIRAVSTRTKTKGIYDITFHEINTILIIDNVVSSIRKTLKQLIKGAKNNETTLAAIGSQSIIELQNKKFLGIIESFNPPNVYKSSSDPSVCIVELSFTVSHGLNQILITAFIKV